MKRIILSAIAVLFLPVLVRADTTGLPVKGTALHLAPQAGTPPASCLPVGQVCVWYDGNTSTWKLRMASGSDAAISTGSGLPSQTGNAGKVLTTDGANPAWASVAYDPAVPVVLKIPHGAQVDHGMYYGPTAGVNIGTQWQYEAALAMEGDGNGYLWSAGYAGAHEMLWGYSGGFPSGNVWNGTAAVTYGGIDGVQADEWHVYSVSGDGSNIWVHVDGVPDGAVAFSSNRVTVGASGGGGHIFVGGSDHSNLAMKVGWIRTYETVDPLNGSGASGCAYRPQWNPAPDYNQGAAYPNFLADYTKPGAFVADVSDGYNGHHHPGQLYVPGDATCTGRAMIDMDIISGWNSCMTKFPLPKWIVDSTAPFQAQSAPTPPAYTGSTPSPPGGAKIFDSFSRADSDYIWTATPSLGSTEAGSLGAKAWSTKFINGTNSEGATNGSSPPAWSDWGIFKGWAVNLDCFSNAGVYGTVAWVMSDAADMTVSVDRHPATGGYDPWGLTGIALRVAADGSTGIAILHDTSSNIYVATWAAGTETIIATLAQPSSTWTNLKATVSGTTVTVYCDGTSIGTATTSVGSTNTGAGLWRHAAGNGFFRYDNFTVQ